MRLYATPGLVIIDPATRQPLPDEGIEAGENDLYWVRALNDGDMTTEPPAASDERRSPAKAQEGTEP